MKYFKTLFVVLLVSMALTGCFQSNALDDYEVPSSFYRDLPLMKHAEKRATYIAQFIKHRSLERDVEYYDAIELLNLVETYKDLIHRADVHGRHAKLVGNYYLMYYACLDYLEIYDA